MSNGPDHPLPEPRPTEPPPRAPAVARLARRWFSSASESSLRSLLKAVSWRVCGSLDTTALAFIFTRDLKLSAAIGATEIVTKIVLYYIHERLWARLAFGRARSAAGAVLHD